MNIQLQDEIIKYFIDNSCSDNTWLSFRIPNILKYFETSGYLKEDVKNEIICLIECYPQYMHFFETSLFVIESGEYNASDYIKTDSGYKSHVNIHRLFFLNN